jgi:hypothetical protein
MRTRMLIVALAILAGTGAFFALSPTHADEITPSAIEKWAEAVCAASNGTLEIRGNMAFCVVDRHELAPDFKGKDINNTPKSLEESRA